MPVFATSVIFVVFAVPAFSGIFHWNLPAGQYLSQPWTWLHQPKRRPRNDSSRRQPTQSLTIDRSPSLRITDSLLGRHQRLLLQLQLLSRQSFVNPAPKRCHLKWQLDGWGINRRTNAPSRRLHQLQNALPRRQTRPQTTTLPRFSAAPRQNRLPPSATRP